MVEATLADWSSRLVWASVPGQVQAAVIDILLDAVASGIAGRTQALVAQIEPPVEAFAGPGSAATRTFIDAYAITSATLCDVYRPALCHVTPVVVPPLLALADRAGASGEELLTALTVGLETTVRLAGALDYPELRQRGWHSPGVVGPVGAAAAAARLLRLEPQAAQSAMAHAAAQAAGTFASLGTEAVKFNQARGAIAGLLAAQMASAGLAAAPNWLTHPDGGMATAYSDGGEPKALVDGLGEHWELTNISLRQWPAASSVQSLIELCLETEGPHGTIREVEIELGTDAYRVSGERGWDVPLAAQQSARWVAAATLHDRTWWLEQSSPARIADRETGAFAEEHVRVTRVDDLGQAAVRTTFVTADGQRVLRAREHAPGDPERPLTPAQIDAKTERAAASAGRSDAHELIAGCRSLAEGRAAAPFVQLIRSEVTE